MRLPLRLLPTHGPVAFLLLGALVLVLHPVFNLDIFWHMANGREMLASGRVIDTEIFSWTASGRPYDNHAWLSQVLFEAIYSRFGADGLLALKLLVVSVIFFMAYATARLWPLPRELAALLAFTVIAVGEQRYMVRPHLFSLLNLVLLSYLLFAHLRGRHGWRRTLLWVPLLIAVWEIQHGAVFGLAFLLAFVAGTLPWLNDASGTAESVPTRYRAYLALLLAILLVELLHPYGWRAYGFFVDYVTHRDMVTGIAEWQPTPLQGYLPYWIWLALVTACGLDAARRRHWVVFFVALPFAYLSLQHARAVAPFALASLPLVASSVAHHIGRFNARRVRLTTLAGAALILAVSAHYKFVTASVEFRLGGGMFEAYRAFGCARFLAAQAITGPLYNNARFGGELAYLAGPTVRIYQFNHHVLFADLFRANHSGRFSTDPFNAAVIGDERELALFPLATWAPVYHEPAAMLLLRRNSTNAALIQRYEIRYFEPLPSAERRARLRTASPGVRARLALELSDHLALRNDPVLAQWLAELLGDASLQLPPLVHKELLKRALTLNPSLARLTSGAGD